jgi:crotonobetainyl-CoA:carnitine CoA-transferase CaiB-like acyl-CoA transferase
MTVRMPHPLTDTLCLVASPMKFSATPVRYRRPPPLLGEHTEEILRDELGLDAAAITALRGDGVI